MLPETSETEQEDQEAVAALVWETHEDASDMTLVINCLCTCCSDRNKHRRVVATMVKFETMDQKHTFLKHAKQLKPAGMNWDDYLTRQRQKERQDLTADFQLCVERATNLLSRLSTEVPCCRPNQEVQTWTCSQG